MTDGSDVELEHFKLVVDHYKQDIREYWTKANFFFIVNTGLLSAYILYLNQTNNFPIFKIALPLTGIAIAAFFYLILDSSHFWTKVWRGEVLKLCRERKKFGCYTHVETMAQGAPHKHPGFWTQLLDITFVLVWFGFLVINLEGIRNNGFALNVVAATLGGVSIMTGYLFYVKEKRPLKFKGDSNPQDEAAKNTLEDDVL